MRSPQTENWRPEQSERVARNPPGNAFVSFPEADFGPTSAGTSARWAFLVNLIPIQGGIGKRYPILAGGSVLRNAV
jgi:hypothetical protein